MNSTEIFILGTESVSQGFYLLSIICSRQTYPKQVWRDDVDAQYIKSLMKDIFYKQIELYNEVNSKIAVFNQKKQIICSMKQRIYSQNIHIYSQKTYKIYLPIIFVGFLLHLFIYKWKCFQHLYVLQFRLKSSKSGKFKIFLGKGNIALQPFYQFSMIIILFTIKLNKKLRKVRRLCSVYRYSNFFLLNSARRFSDEANIISLVSLLYILQAIEVI